MGKLHKGGFINEGLNLGKKSKIIHYGGGRILISNSAYQKFGADFFRSINDSPNAEIIVVPDEKLDNMTAVEKMQLINNL